MKKKGYFGSLKNISISSVAFLATVGAVSTIVVSNVAKTGFKIFNKTVFN